MLFGSGRKTALAGRNRERRAVELLRLACGRQQLVIASPSERNSNSEAIQVSIGVRILEVERGE